MRRAVWGGVTALLVLVLLGAVLLWRDAQAAEAALRDARAALNEGEQALTGDEDSEAAQAAFQDASDQADTARARLDGLGWAVVGLLPRVGGSTELARAATDLADASADLGAAATQQAENLLDGNALEEVMADGRVDLARLDQLAATVDDLPTQPVLDARERLASIRPGTVLASLRDDRTAALAQVDAVLARIDRVKLGLEATRSFLGGGGSRTYLVAAQNPAELRGTGGLIGFLTELTVDDGAISLADGVSVDAEDELALRTELDSVSQLPNPVQRPAAFADRYDHIAGGSFFGSVNADPDLPTVAPVLLDLYAQEVGSPLDGVVMVDPVALGMIVSATGEPLELPAELDTAGLPHRIPGGRLADVVMIEGYDAFEGGGPGKKALDRAIIMAGFERLTAGGWDAAEMGRTLGEAFATRHLQLFSHDEEVQSAFQTLGLAGQMTTTGNIPRDVLAVTGINAAADKSDVHVAHRIGGELRLGPVRDGAPVTAERSGTLKVTVDNPLRPGDHNTYITGSNEPLQIGSAQSERVDDALNRTWFSVWAVPTTEATEVREGDERQLFRATSIHGHRVFDYFLETPSASTNSFEIDLGGRVELAREGNDVVYRVALWRQAKAIPDHWNLTVAAPRGWEIAAATVEGGGKPTGMGVGGDDGQPLQASVENGSAHLVGAATTDAVLEIRLTRD